MKIPTKCALVFLVGMWICNTSDQVRGEVSHGDPEVLVGANIHITKAHADKRHRETAICADIEKPNELTMGVLYDVMRDREIWNVALYVSHDGGNSWILAKDIPNSIDPTCAYGSHGMLYAMSMRVDGIGGVGLHRSSDYGRSWLSIFTPEGSFWDRPWLAIDSGDSSNRGTVYFSVGNVASVAVFRSTNSGGSLSSPVVLSGSKAEGDTSTAQLAWITGQIVVLTNGLVVTSRIRYGPEEVREVFTSEDGGRTFSPSALLSKSPSERINGNKQKPVVNIHNMPMLAADLSGGPYRNRVYAVWTSLKTGRAQTWFTYSRDQYAKDWAPARVIDDTSDFDPIETQRGPNHVNPAIAVNKDGIIGISWADRRGVPQPGYQTRFIASLDGGETWSRSVPVATAFSSGRYQHRYWTSTYRGFDRVKAWTLTFQKASGGPQDEPGDFWSISADSAGRFHPAWVDDRTGVAQIWTTTITVNGTVHRIREITGDVKIRFGTWTHNPLTHTLTVDVMILNASGKPIPGPFLIKWAHPEEYLRTVDNAPRMLIARNSENGWTGPGAIWTTRNADIIKPGETSGPLKLKFVRRQNLKKSQLGDQLGVRVFVREQN